MMKTIFHRSAFVTAIILICSAHIGSPDAWYSGRAGPYAIQVQVKAPTVVPGIAKISVVVQGEGVRQVTASVNKFDATAAAPPPDVALRDERNPELFTTDLWVMSGGSNAVTVTVSGDKGRATTVIPVAVVATKVLQMDQPMGYGLAAVGLFLLIGAITIIASASRESVLEPGVEPDAQRRRVSRIAAGVATVLIAGILFGGWTWWSSEEAAYKRRLFKPMRATANAYASPGGLKIEMSVSESSWIKRRDSLWLSKNGRSTYSPLIPDHGKLMHLFVIGGPDNSTFVHLHPSTTDSVTFASALPALPPGKYKAFGDIVHESGFSQTLSSSFDVLAGAQGSSAPSDPDDAWLIRASVPGATQVTLDDGSSLKWETASLHRGAGREAGLKFSITAPDGAAAVLEPYMGMAGHAVVMREDGGVFVHLHPSGTVSMASQMALEMRKPGDSVVGTLSKRMANTKMPGTDPASYSGDSISFPYAFPQRGNYIVWVQVKRSGRIQTGAFRVAVKD